MPLAMPVSEARKEVEQVLARVATEIPSTILPDLPPGEWTSGMPDWYPFEWAIWEMGAEIQRLMDQAPKLRCDPDLCESFLRIVQDRRAKRGRQSFASLFGYTGCAPFAGRLAAQIDDWHIEGQVIDSLLKMRVPGFADVIRPSKTSRFAWIRNKAKLYCSRYGT